MEWEFEKSYHELHDELVKRGWTKDLETLNEYYNILRDFDEQRAYSAMQRRMNKKLGDRIDNLTDGEVEIIKSMMPETPHIKKFSTEMQRHPDFERNGIIPCGTFLETAARIKYRDTVEDIKKKLDCK